MSSSERVMPFPRRSLPPMTPVRQRLPSDRVEDVQHDVSQKLEAFGLARKISRGSRIAMTAGSRGIGGLTQLLSGIADAVRRCGGEPFIIPAMGSHGGATADGQAEILRRLGVSEQSARACICSSMETAEIGVSETGAVAHVDRLACEADGIIVVGRTKTHPESAGELASGLLKMCTIGLGKQVGAHQAHSHGLWDSVRAVPKLQLAKAKILCGVAVIENGYREPCVIEVVPPAYDAFLDADMRLLRVAKEHLARVPFEDLDLLVVDELGKTISGAGMDPNVIGHWRNSDAQHHPNYRRIAVLSLTYPSLGNGLGIGMADFTTRRFKQAYDPAVSYINLLTASEPGGNTREGPLPLALHSDQEAMEVALFSSLAGRDPKVCRIKNTASLDEFWVSEGLLPQVDTNPKLQRFGEPAPFAFDAAGNLF